MPQDQTLFFLREHVILSFGDQVEQVEEFREGDGGCVRTVDAALACGPQGRDGKGHGDAMISAGIDLGSVKFLSAANIKSVFELFHLGAHGAQIRSNKGDAVRLLDAQLFSVANANALPGVGSDGGQHRQLVDQLRSESAGDGSGSQAFARSGELHRAD